MKKYAVLVKCGTVYLAVGSCVSISKGLEYGKPQLHGENWRLKERQE